MHEQGVGGATIGGSGSLNPPTTTTSSSGRGSSSSRREQQQTTQHRCTWHAAALQHAVAAPAAAGSRP